MMTNKLTVSAMAEKLGITSHKLTSLIQRGAVTPPATPPGGRRRYYDASQVAQLRREVAKWESRPATRCRRVPNGFVSRTEIGKRAGLSGTTISHHQATGRIPLPTHRAGPRGGAYYTEDEATKILAILKGRDRALDHAAAKRKRAGFYGVRDVAEAKGMSFAAVSRMVRDGELPPPTHLAPNTYPGNLRRYWTRAEFRKIVGE